MADKAAIREGDYATPPIATADNFLDGYWAFSVLQLPGSA